MASALVAAAAVSALKLLVGTLVKEIAKEVVTPMWKNNSNAIRLHRMLSRLEDAVSRISPEQCDTATEQWLQHLADRLEAVKKVLNDNNKQGVLPFKGYSISKKLSQEIKELSDLFQDVVLYSTTATLEVCHRQEPFFKEIKELLYESQGWQMADVTRTAMETPTSNFGCDVGLITPHEAFLKIKDQADNCLSLGASSSLSSSTHFRTKVAPEQMLRRQDSMTIYGGNQVVESGKELLLAADYESHWAGLWATGGAGKTLAAQRIFNDSFIRAHFTGGCYWLTVGKAKAVGKLLFQLQQDALLNSHERPSGHYSDQELKNHLSSKLRDREKVLLVLDDVWDEETLLRLDVLPRDPIAGCRVLVTTRNQEILDKRHAHKIQVPLLGPDDSWKLFCWHACRGVSRMPVELSKLAEEITKECKGLPLALKVIGGVFSGKTDMKIRNWKGFWELSLQKLKNADILSPEHEGQLYLRLKWSVDELDEIDPHLRECFLYFAAFPEDEEVDLAKDLFPLWLGDQIVGTHNDYDPEDEAFRLLGWLISRSLIELHGQPGRNHIAPEHMKCKVHDVLRDLARYMLQHNVPVEKRLCLYESGRDLKCMPLGWVPASKDDTKLNATEISARRLSIMSGHLEELPPRLLDAPNLRVMILRDNHFKAIPDRFFHNIRNLTVLDLGGCPFQSLPGSLGVLKNLLVLKLRHCLEMLKLPSSLGNLTNLEMLNLEQCRKLEYLPSSFSSLTKLQYLNLSTGKMSMWPETGNIRNWLSGRAALKDLIHLVELKQLDILSDSQKALPLGFEKAFRQLRTLRLMFTKLTTLPETFGDDLPHLKILELQRCEALTSLPNSFVSLQNLHTLSLNGCHGLLSLPPLDGLPSLVCLDLSGCFNLRSLPGTFSMPGSFPALKELIMHACDNIESFPDLQPGAMPQLEILNVSFWIQLVNFPKPLGNLTTLRSLNLAGCVMKTLEQDSVDLHCFPDLEELDVMDCKNLSQLPASLASLPRLRKIDNRRCPANVPAELLHLATKL